MTLLWREEPLSRSHSREHFDCGEPALNDYLRRYARQNHESGGAKTFVAVQPDLSRERIIGYYSLCPASLEYASAPETVRRGLGRYDVPVFRLGRLAVDVTVRRQGLVGQLLISAAKRCIAVAAQVGGVALLVDAKNNKVAGWYASYGAVPLYDTPLSLLLPFTVVEKLGDTS